MVPEKISNVEMMSKANVYWDGKVTSRTFFHADGSKHTLGIITAGTYTFGVGDREIVTLIAGEVEVGQVQDARGLRDPGELRLRHPYLRRGGVPLRLLQGLTQTRSGVRKHPAVEIDTGGTINVYCFYP